MQSLFYKKNAIFIDLQFCFEAETAFKSRNPSSLGKECWESVFGIVLILLRFRLWYYRNEAFGVAALVEINDSVHQSVKSVILANADIFARVVPCSALTNNDVSSHYLLAAPNFHA